MSDFIKDCINGDALLSEIDNYIDNWHNSDLDIPLHTFLGMTKKEYVLFVEDETYLGIIVTSHRNNQNIDEIIESQIALAARSDNHAKAKRLEKWLKDEGLWK